MDVLYVDSDRQIPDLMSSVGVLTIEVDPQQLATTGGRTPEPVDREAALRLGEAIASDLGAILGDVERFGLVLPGAVYDQTELLRPGFPIAEALEAVFRGTLRAQGYRPQLIALGRESGEVFPIDALNPEFRPGAGPILLIPFAFVGPAEILSPFAARMEQSLLHEGVTSTATRKAVQESFGLRPVHVSYATLADLCALLSVQLEQNGFEALWAIMEHGLLKRDGPIGVQLPEGNLFVAAGRDVWSPFYTLDQWASATTRAKGGDDALETYAAWTKLQRQYSVALEAYGYCLNMVLPVEVPDGNGNEALLASLQAGITLTGEWYCESPDVGPFGGRSSALVVTHHSHADLGTIAYTVETVDSTGGTLSTEHFYPLVPDGLQRIVETIEQRGESEGLPRTIIHPECVLYDSFNGRLRGSDSSIHVAPTRH